MALDSTFPLDTHHDNARRGSDRGLLLFLAEMAVAQSRELAVIRAQLHSLHTDTRHIMAAEQDVLDELTGLSTKVDTIGTNVDALEAAIANSSAATDAAVAAELDKVKAAVDDVGTHVDTVSGKFGGTPTPASKRKKH
ncbi:MAG: hypothetical protein H0U66_06215 [Gemmatimonadaceae bacterium]|nr:hypothetical protein [Gemmatimonadaceae bacterium]